MLDELLPYYEEELTALRQQSRAFAAQYPKIAARLMLDGDACEDPHVERMIESFAFLAARIHKKLDDDYPQITEALLSVLYPHFLRPVPSMSIAQLALAPGIDVTGIQRIAAGTALLTRPVKGLPVRYRCAWPVDVAPVDVTEARCEAIEQSSFALGRPGDAATVRIRLQVQGSGTFAALGLQRLRFYLDGESAIAHALQEILLTSTDSITLAPAEGEPPAPPLRLPARHLRAAGLGEDEGLLDYDPRSFLGYRLLQDYFALPEKFLFIELDGLDLQRFHRSIDLRFHLRPFGRPERLARLEQAVQASTFRLHCTPIVNLFRQQAEPIRLTQQVHEYPVIPDVRRPQGLEVYAIESVRRHTRGEAGERVQTYPPLYAIGPAADDGGDGDLCWMSRRSASILPGDGGTDVHLTLVVRQLNARLPVVDTLSIALTCTNRDLPALLPFGGDDSLLQLEEAGAVAGARLLKKPSATSRAALRHASQWKLISHLSLNHLSIVEGGRDALLEILSLYNFSDAASLRKQIAGIVDIRSEPAVLRVGRSPRQAFVRGTEISLTFDESQYVGTGVHVLAQVLDVFFGLYSTANSWTRLTAHSLQRETPVAVFAPRLGAQPLV